MWRRRTFASFHEAAKLIQRCLETAFIMAHGFWLMTEDRKLDILADYFDQYRNLNVDFSAVYRKHPTYRHWKELVRKPGRDMVVDANTKAIHRARA
jgi:hypothetical protein